MQPQHAGWNAQPAPQYQQQFQQNQGQQGPAWQALTQVLCFFVSETMQRMHASTCGDQFVAAAGLMSDQCKLERNAAGCPNTTCSQH